MNNVELGKFLAKLRQEKKITQEQLSEMLCVDKRKISRWETGTSMPEFDMLIKLTKIYDITLYELSICQRIENKSLIEKVKYKFKSIEDLKKYSLKRKVMIIFAAFLGVFLSLSAIYTISNYKKIVIYNLYSIDENYILKANYIKAKNYGVINLLKVKNINDENNPLNKQVKIDHYEIRDSDGALLLLFNQDINNESFLDDKSLFSTEIFEDSFILKNNKTYTFIIYYFDENKLLKDLKIGFKVNKMYVNKLLNQKT